MSSDRRSLPRRAVKRKAEEAEEKHEEEEEAAFENEESSEDSKRPRLDVPPALSYRWIDSGNSVSNGQVEHQLLEAVVNGTTTIVAVGDTILLRSSEETDEDEEPFVAKVERMWQAPVRKNQIKEYCMKVRARWYFKKMDVQDLRGTFSGPVTKQQLLASMTDRDLILSNQYDDNDVLTLLSKCTVINRRPSPDDKTPIPLPPRVWVSRYSISFGDTPGTSYLTAYDGENQPWPTEDEDAVEIEEEVPEEVEDVEEEQQEEKSTMSAEEDVAMETSTDPPPPAKRYRIDDDEETDFTEDTVSEDGRARPLSEGPNNKGKIVIDAEHQAEVTPFREGQKVKSRQPTLVWSAHSDADVDKFLEGAAGILLEYLEQNHLMSKDPYFPLPHEHMETLLKELELCSMTLSNLSTGSSMTMKRNKLTRECDLDALLALFHETNYDVEDALEQIRLSPQDYVISWTLEDREKFDNGYRRYSGSLRMITSRILMSKQFKDVVDYHYRFKIPDQFRRYQDTKREHAIRMMEIIENRRTEETTIPLRENENRRRSTSDIVTANISNNNSSKAPDWTKTSITDVVGVVEDRRSSAKELLLDIQQAVGTPKLGQICQAIKSLHNKSVEELKRSVEEILQHHPILLDRFMEYLPKKYHRT